jgi:hypothetical protein
MAGMESIVGSSGEPRCGGCGRALGSSLEAVAPVEPFSRLGNSSRRFRPAPRCLHVLQRRRPSWTRADRLIPADELGPGAQAGVPSYRPTLSGAYGSAAKWYAGP